MPPRPAMPRITWPANSVPGRSSDIRQPAVDLFRAAQARDPQAGQPPRVLAPAARLVLECVREQRVAAPYRAAPGLGVAVPQLLPAANAPERPAREPRQPDARRQVEP